jgi:Ribonuclease G/E
LPEWLIERGIGETRFALVEDGEIVEARIELEGTISAGSVIRARLTSIGANGRNAVAVDDDGREYLLPRGAAGASEGARVHIEVTRQTIPGAEPWKRPLGQVTDAPPHQEASPEGRGLALPAPRDELATAGWNDLLDEARTAVVSFPGGELRVSVTPAMTLIDVDGALPPRDLALAGARAAVRTIIRHGVGGSIGIDLPTIAGKAERKAVDEAIDAALPQPFERTAMNGFGFVQIVRPRRRASSFELAHDRAAFEARALLRRSAFESAGSKTLVAHPAVCAVLQAHNAWIEALSRQVGGPIGLRADGGLTMSGGYAEPQ